MYSPLLAKASLKINEKADVPNPCSPGVYRRISATKELLHEDTTTVKLRHHNSTKKLLKKFSTPRKSCGEILAEKFAESNHKSRPGWSNNHQDYQLGEVIGTGATATVHSAICIPRNEKCAIKRINLEKWNTSMDELLKEIQTMSACHHENVVTYYTSFVVKEELWLVIKLLAGGSLLDIIKHEVKTEDCYNGVFDEVTIATVMKEVLKGLEYFHNNGQIHRDIKAGNILLGANGSVQIADFGVSSSIATLGDLSRERSRHTFVGTPCWMAPEVMEQVKGYDFKADIWSFGITVIELITGTAPYHKYPPMKVLMLTLQNDPPSLESVTKEKDQYKDYGKSIRKLITDCLQKDPAKRPSATELLKHPFFKKAKDKNYLQRTLLAEIPDVEKRASLKRHKQRISDAKRYSESGDWKWDLDQDTKLENANNSSANNSSASNSSANNSSANNSSANNSSSESNQSSDNNNLNKDVYQSDPFEQKTIKLTLRIRNINRELNDILFEFKSHDTPEGVAHELIDDGLINNKDLIVIKSNLEKLINNYIITKQPCTVTFALNSNQSGEVIDEKTLLGFAQLSIAE